MDNFYNFDYEGKGSVDTQATINPYDIGNLLWNYISPTLADYNIDFTQVYPKTKPDNNTVVWEIQRVPGWNERLHKLNAAPTNNYITENGELVTENTQYHTVTLYLYVFSKSMADLNRLSWDVEQAMVNVVGSLQELDPGFTLHFLEQPRPTTFQVKQQDDIIKNIISFIIKVPVRFRNVEAQLQGVEVAAGTGEQLVRENIVYTGPNKKHYLSLPDNKRLTFVSGTSFSYEGNQMLASSPTDYLVELDKELQKPYIIWKPNRFTPEVGQEFTIEYAVNTSRTLSSIV